MPRGARRTLLTALVVSVGLAVWHFVGSRKEAPSAGQSAQPPVAQVPATPTGAAASPPATVGSAAAELARDPAIVAFHELTVDAPLIAVAHQAGDPAALQSFRVRLGPDRFADIDVARFDAINDDEGVYSGAVRDQRDSQAVFSYVGLAYAGTVVLPAEERAFYITATEEGRMRITELDLTRAPVCGQPLLAQGPPTVAAAPDPFRP